MHMRVNIFLYDLFLLMKDEDIASYADENTPYMVRDNIDQIVSALQNAATSLFKRSSDNQMKANPDKCHLPLKETPPWHRNFPVNFAKFLRTAFFSEHLRWLLL